MIPIQIVLPVHPFCWDGILFFLCQVTLHIYLYAISAQEVLVESEESGLYCCNLRSVFTVAFKRRWRILSNASEKINGWTGRWTKKTSWFRYFPANKHSNGHPSFGNFPFPRYLTRVLYLIGECETQSFQITKTSQLHKLFGRKRVPVSQVLLRIEKKHRIHCWWYFSWHLP